MPSGRFVFRSLAVSMAVLLQHASGGEATSHAASAMEGLASKASETLSSLLGTTGHAASAEGSTRAAPSPAKTLDTFCGLNIGGQTVSEPMVFDCSCCATAMNGDYAAQVELLYGGHKVMSPARNADSSLAGEVPLWSLGKYEPELVCHDGPKGPEASCNCAAQDKTWVEFEPSCRAGSSCRRVEPPSEWPTVCAEGEHCSARDQALSREGGGTPPVVDLGGMQQCDAGIPPEKQARGPKVARRVSLGSARCEDMAPEQCHLFYAKVDDTWRQCEATASTVRQCGATVVKEASAAAETARVEAWAIKHAYLPDSWPVNVHDDGTIEAASKPSREDFMKQIGNLPKKMHQSYVI